VEHVPGFHELLAPQLGCHHETVRPRYRAVRRRLQRDLGGPA
jgi:hypothetical protein